MSEGYAATNIKVFRIRSGLGAASATPRAQDQEQPTQRPQPAAAA